jgi:catechol 2,3-dioxygenase-like lactoylglutathione lyase family enzyme
VPSIVHVTLVVRDYDEAIAFFTKVLDFVLVEDTFQREQNKRWVVVAPPGSTGASLVLGRAANEEQVRFIGNQAGGRVFLFLETDDFSRDYHKLTSRGVVFVREPKPSLTARLRCSRICTATCGTWCSSQPNSVTVPGAAHEIRPALGPRCGPPDEMSQPMCQLELAHSVLSRQRNSLQAAETPVARWTRRAAQCPDLAGRRVEQLVTDAGGSIERSQSSTNLWALSTLFVIR